MLQTVFVCLILLVRGSLGVITIENNGYKGIVVAIHNSVPEDYRIVENLQELFTSASQVLHHVTRERAYFDEVSIYVPANWTSQKNYEAAIGGSRFATADVRVDFANSDYGDNPYTLQAGSCGRSGQYIHLTPEFLEHLNGATEETYGHPGKMFVHEWAHYRYGVFDEYGDRNDFQTHPFYFDEENKIRPTGCSANIPGWLADEGGEPCRLGPDGLPDDNCRFYPNFNEKKVHSSLMYLQYLPTMEGFCDETEELKHNAAAPSKQNVLCNGKSTWEVVGRHPDFVSFNNRPRSNIKTKPKFRVLQPQKNDAGYYVLVLDVSGSMSGRRIAMLHRAASRFVQSQIPERSHLGIVAFSTEPRVIANLTLITPETRQSLLTRLPLKDDGANTAIGRGIEVAIQILRQKLSSTEGAVIILISDGEENVSPFIAEILPEIVASRVKINTIAFGSQASLQLEKLVRLTGGQGFFFSDDDIFQNKASNLQAAFFAAAATQADIDLQPVELNSRVFDLKPGAQRNGNLIIDRAIGRNTQFAFMVPFPNSLEITLTSPNKTVYNNRSSVYSRDDVTGSASFVIPLAEPGKWVYTIRNLHPQKQSVGVSVTSEPMDIRKQPIRIRSWISDVEFRFPEDASEAKIFAEVKQKYSPVVGATVLAEVERPFGDHVDVFLHDNGAGADITRNDGIYSAYFTQFQGGGRYSVSARVVNDGNARLRIKKKNGKKKTGAVTVQKFNPAKHTLPGKAQKRFDPKDLSPSEGALESDFEEEAVEDFERSLMAGAFSLQGWKEEGDLIPPNRVIDLWIESVSLNDRTVTLSWTAPGDDMETGKANKTDLRFHTQISQMYDDFDNAFVVSEEHVVNGTLVPPNGGGRQHVTIRIGVIADENLRGNTVYFAMRCYDEANNPGDVSNVVPARFVAPPHKTMSHSHVTLLAVVAIVVLLVCTVAIVIAIRACKKRQERKKSFA